MSQDDKHKNHICPDLDSEDIRAENEALQAENRRLTKYIRKKTNDLLNVMGTVSLKAEELDDATLIEFDPIGIVTGSFAQVLANLRNTNHKLHQAHQEIQAVFDSVGAAVLVLDPKQNIIAYNNKVRENMFFGEGDITGRLCRDVICNQRDPGECAHKRVLTSGQVELMSGWELNGRSFDVIGQPIKNVDGQLTHVVLAYSDVTEHRRNSYALQRALIEMQEAKAQIDDLLKSMADGLIASDEKGRVVLMNPAAERLLETSFGLCLGKSIQNITNIPKLKLHFHELVLGSTNHICDFNLKGTDSSVQTYQARTSEVKNVGNKIGGRITFLHDVSRERESDRIKDEFLSTAAHQLRTPLTAVIGFSELILNSESIDDTTRNEYISMIYSKAEQLSEIVSNLLDVSRIESGGEPAIVREPVLVNALIEDTLESFRLGCNNHIFEVNTQDNKVFLDIDSFAMHQALENLVSNAVKYSPEGGTIRIDGLIVDNSYQLSVIDPGIGMTDKQSALAFNKFYRADASNTAISGTGLGLTIVRYIVEAHDGTVWIESRPGSGTTVHLTLPLYS